MKKESYINKKMNQLKAMIGGIIGDYVEYKIDPNNPHGDSYETFANGEYCMGNPYLILDDIDPDGLAPKYFTIDRYIDMLADDENFTEKEKDFFGQMVSYKYAKFVIINGGYNDFFNIETN